MSVAEGRFQPEEVKNFSAFQSASKSPYTLFYTTFYFTTPLVFLAFCIYFRLDSNAPAEVQIEATVESDQGVDGNLFFA